jgi:hypothetical protein
MFEKNICKPLIGIVFFLLLTANAIAFDLWNGFTTEMTKDEVLSKTAIELAVGSNHIESNSFNDALYPFNGRHRLVLRQGPATDTTITNGRFWQSPYDNRYSVIKVYSPKPEYFQSKYTKNWPNITFYFFTTKLYAVNIVWEARHEDLLSLITSRFGNYNAIIDVVTSAGEINTSSIMWKLKDRLIYLAGGNSMYVIDRSVIDGWIEENQRDEQQKKTEEEARRREAASGVKF